MWSQTNQKISQLGNQCQLGELGLGFAAGLVVLGFSFKQKCIMVDTIHMYGSYHFLWLGGLGIGWMVVDGFG